MTSATRTTGGPAAGADPTAAAGPAAVAGDPVARVFLAHRPVLSGLAYRMLGSWHDAEDVLQEAYLRWAAADRAEVHTPRAWLVRVVTRLSVDQLRRRQARRESYVGQWLPEPVAGDPSPFGAADTSDLSMAVLHLMEQLTPPQRAVFVLRAAFELPYDEIATVVERSAADCRQLYRRAERLLHEGRASRFTPDPQQHRQLLADFVAAARAGDLERLRGLLHTDAVAWTDGGGRVTAALNPIVSAPKVARFFAGIYSRPPWLATRPVWLNAAPALLVWRVAHRHVLFLDGEPGAVHRLFVVANPDKLDAVAPG